VTKCPPCICGNTGRFFQDDDGVIARHCICGGAQYQDRSNQEASEIQSAAEFFDGLHEEQKAKEPDRITAEFVSRCVDAGMIVRPDRLGNPDFNARLRWYSNKWDEEETEPLPEQDGGRWVLTITSGTTTHYLALEGVPEDYTAQMVVAHFEQLVRNYFKLDSFTAIAERCDDVGAPEPQFK